MTFPKKFIPHKPHKDKFIPHKPKAKRVRETTVARERAIVQYDKTSSTPFSIRVEVGNSVDYTDLHAQTLPEAVKEAKGLGHEVAYWQDVRPGCVPYLIPSGVR